MQKSYYRPEVVACSLGRALTYFSWGKFSDQEDYVVLLLFGCN